MDIDINSPVEIAGVKFGNRLMNGAYIGSKTIRDIKELVEADSGGVVVGSISVSPRDANSGHRYWRHKQQIYSLNSYGMPNGGIPYFKKHLPKMVSIAHEHHKPLIANIVGFSKEEFMDLILLAQVSGADMVELNFSCPNVWDSQKQKEILSYNPVLIKSILKFISKNKPLIPLSIKLSPLPPDLLREIANIIADSRIVRVVTATNSYPNASLSSGTKVDNEEALAGMSGRSLKPISLGVVKQLSELLPNDIDIIGCGGISSLNDARDFLQAGAKAIQMATSLIENGLQVFTDILSQI